MARFENSQLIYKPVTTKHDITYVSYATAITTRKYKSKIQVSKL